MFPTVRYVESVQNNRGFRGFFLFRRLTPLDQLLSVCFLARRPDATRFEASEWTVFSSSTTQAVSTLSTGQAMGDHQRCA